MDHGSGNSFSLKETVTLSWDIFLADMFGNKPETLASTLDALGPRQALDLTDLTIKTHSAHLITKHIY